MKAWSYKTNSYEEIQEDSKCSKCGDKIGKWRPLISETDEIFCSRNCYCKPVKVKAYDYYKNI